MVQDELKHFGVLGMKWGVRRSQGSLDRAAGRKAEKAQRKDVAARMKRDKRRMLFDDVDTGGRTSQGQAIIERVFKDSQGKPYTTKDISVYNSGRTRKRVAAWVAAAIATDLAFSFAELRYR